MLRKVPLLRGPRAVSKVSLIACYCPWALGAEKWKTNRTQRFMGLPGGWMDVLMDGWVDGGSHSFFYVSILPCPLLTASLHHSFTLTRYPPANPLVASVSASPLRKLVSAEHNNNCVLNRNYLGSFVYFWLLSDAKNKEAFIQILFFLITSQNVCESVSSGKTDDF